MKIILLTLIMLLTFGTAVYAYDESIEHDPGQYDGESIEYDLEQYDEESIEYDPEENRGFGAAAQIVLDSPDLLPLRTVAEALGAMVTWEDDTRTVIVTRDELNLAIPIDYPLPDGMGRPVIIEGRTYVPKIFLTQAMYAHVEWYEDTRTAYVFDWNNIEPEPMPTVPPVFPVRPRAYELLNRAGEVLIESGSVMMTTESLMSISMLGETIEVQQSGTVAQVIRSETDVDIRMDLTTTVFGTEMQMISYFRDGTVYVNILDEWVKMEMPMEDFLAQTGMHMAYQEENIISENIVSTGEGYLINYTLAGVDIISMIEASMVGMEDLDLDHFELNMSDAVITTLIDRDGTLRSMDMFMTMEIVVQDTLVSTAVEMRNVVIQMGDVEIDFPEELDEIES